MFAIGMTLVFVALLMQGLVPGKTNPQLIQGRDLVTILPAIVGGFCMVISLILAAWKNLP